MCRSNGAKSRAGGSRSSWPCLTAVGTAGAAGSTPAADAALRARVRDDDLTGGVLFVARDGQTLHRLAVGTTTAHTVIPIASASKWLTSATLMTFVDEGKLASTTR